jgi:DNA polymerase-3 subunit epsilon
MRIGFRRLQIGRNEEATPNSSDRDGNNGAGFAVIDFETTGLFPGGHDRIIEVAVVHVDPHGVVEGEWDTLVNPGRDLGPQAIHHIKASDILDAPNFAQIAQQLVQLLSGRVIVAHNASFDTRFLNAELSRIGYQPGVEVSVLCTMMLAGDIIPGAGRSLADCCAHFDIDIDGAHRAAADALATAHLLAAYIQATPRESVWADAVASARSPWGSIPSGGAAWKPRPSATYIPPHFLERLATHLPEQQGTEAEQSYLALLDRVLLDRDISVHEANDLVTLSNEFGLDRPTCERVHLDYLRALARVAWADNMLTESEQSDLREVALLLQIPKAELEMAISPLTEADVASADSRSDSVQEFRLRPGDCVVLTGDMARPRDVWVDELEALGLIWINNINKKVKLLAAADPDTLSGKASKARDYGITIVNEDGLARLIAELQAT